MAEKSALDSLFGAPQPTKLLRRFVASADAELQDTVDAADAAKAEAEAPDRDDDRAEAAPVDETERLARTLFIGNLPTTLRAADVRKLFAPQSAVESIRFRSIQLQRGTKLSRQTAVRRHEIDENGTCAAYVVLKSADGAEKFVEEINGTEHFGRVLRADFATAPGQHAEVDAETNRRTVFVGHLPFDATEEEVRGVFGVCGGIHHIRILRDERGRSRGVAYVTFEEEEAVPLAMKFNRAQMRKETITVQRSNPAKAERKKKKALEKGKVKKGAEKKVLKKKKGVEKKKKGAEKKMLMKEGDDGEKKKKKATIAFEGKRAKAHDDDKNQSIKNYLKMRAHIKKKKQMSKGNK